MMITRLIPAFLITILLGSTVPLPAAADSIRETIRTHETYPVVVEKAEALIRTGYTAGDSYGEVWIRDLATFIDLACQVNDPDEIRQQLLLFFHFQGEDGDIIDGFIPRENATAGYDYIWSDSAPDYAGHKNTVETDQESSLVHAVHTYIQRTGDDSILNETVNDRRVIDRLQDAMTFLMEERYSERYGLLWGATTVDWGDVQPEHVWGVELDENSHLTIDVYDNAMFVLALTHLIELLDDARAVSHWEAIRERIRENTRTHLWDAEASKFIPHIYLDDSPFPEEFEEDKLVYPGGTGIAILAEILADEEAMKAYAVVKRAVEESGAATIGLTVYPPYPEGFFLNPSMKPWSYQNGGDWTWFGARFVQALIQRGAIEEAVLELEPMVARVIANDGFFEWYSRENEPRGSGSFRGSAGVLVRAIQMLQEKAEAPSPAG